MHQNVRDYVLLIIDNYFQHAFQTDCKEVVLGDYFFCWKIFVTLINRCVENEKKKIHQFWSEHKSLSLLVQRNKLQKDP